MLKKLSKGFTLIELLVVIAIIAILAALIIIRIGTASRDARNSRRRADMNQIRTAIEQYKNGGGKCTVVGAAKDLTAANFNGGANGFNGYGGPPATYPSIFLAGGTDYPPDPIAGRLYQMTIADTDCTGYTITAPAGEGGGVPPVQG